MKEQPLFAPGDRVVCVDASATKNQDYEFGSTGLIEGKTYTVLGVVIKKCCCTVVIDVGLSRNGIGQCICGSYMQGLVGWKNQKRFVPVDFDRYAEETFHQCLKGKPVNA